MMQKTIRFVLDERIVEIDFSQSPGLSPSTTLLNWLRSLPGHKGVKEGCAEGDCGACTVVLGEPDGTGKIQYRTVDSCLVFLPMVHGKQVITVENLATMNGHEKILHPVQQEMVTANGSQCGYCTPGIVMSLFGIYKNYHQPSREIIKDALAGNLCRCTGYESIIEAALSACSNRQDDKFSSNEKKILELLKEIASNKEAIISTSFNQTYLKPFTLADALKLKAEYQEALVINGSTDIALRQTKKHETLSLLLDLSDVDELKTIREEKEVFVISAGVTIERLRQFSEDVLPALNEVISVFGSLQIRNLATIGGNICSASPIGDTLPVLLAYGAKVKLNSVKSERIIDLEKFITGYRKTDLRKDELLTEIIIPHPGKNVIVSSFKISRRRDLDISTVSAGFRLNHGTGKVSDIILVYGGMAEKVVRASQTEKFLLGKTWTQENVEQAMKIVAEELKPISDARSGAEFRRQVAANLLLKFYLQTSFDSKN